LDQYGYGLKLKEVEDTCISDVGNLSFSFYIHWKNEYLCKFKPKTCTTEWFQILAFRGGFNSEER